MPQPLTAKQCALFPGFQLILPPDSPAALQTIAKVFSQDCECSLGRPCGSETQAGELRIEWRDGPEESWAIEGCSSKVRLVAADVLGAAYGLFTMSRYGLGVDPWSTWYELRPSPRKFLDLSTIPSRSEPVRSRYRGWFINDEVQLRGWTSRQENQERVWELACETLLRLGGNLVIPGTMDAAIRNREVVKGYGLIITHHHHEPLGAHLPLMWMKPFPPDFRYADHQDTLEQAWRESIRSMRDQRVLWSIGFRGHGDYPFWQDDTSYVSTGERAEMINRQVARQVEMVSQEVTDPQFCTNIYGEMTELYREGVLKLPEGCVRIWADNGYGAQRSRGEMIGAQAGLPALPEPGDDATHGIYTHVAFNDNRGANHLLPWTQDPAWVVREFQHTVESGADQLIIVNCGNIRQHVLHLDLWSSLWSQGCDIDIETFLKQLSRRLTADLDDQQNAADALVASWKAYVGARQLWDLADESATIGDQFFHKHVQRMITAAANEKWGPLESCSWLDQGSELAVTLADQARALCALSAPGVESWGQAHATISRAQDRLSGPARDRLQQIVTAAAEYQLAAHRSTGWICKAIIRHQAGQHPAAWLALYHARQQLEVQAGAQDSFAGSGHWHGFYDYDGQTGTRATLEMVRAYAGLLRLRYAGRHLHANWTRAHDLHREDHHYATSGLNVNEEDLAARLQRFLPGDLVS